MLVCCFTGCKDDGGDEDDQQKPESIIFAAAGISDYTVFYAAADGRIPRQIASDIWLEMKSISKTDVVFTDDSAEVGEYEILVEYYDENGGYAKTTFTITMTE